MHNEKELMADIYPSTNRPIVRLAKVPRPLPPEPPRRRKRIITIIIGTPLVAFILFYGIRGFIVKGIATDSVALIQERITQAREALIAFDITEAKSTFTDIKQIIRDLDAEANRYGLLNLAEIVGNFSPKIAAAPQALSVIHRLSDGVLAIIETSEYLKANAFDLMAQKQGKVLIAYLVQLKDEVANLGLVLEEMKHTAAELDYSVGNDVLSFRTELYRSEQLLDAAIDWLSGTNHVAIVFANSSEIRPGGGFPGSYAGVTISRGNLGAINVRDIYDPDGQLDLHVIPPKQLQLITNTWGARDANWFFDFPISARKTLFFLNNSKIYSEQDLTFSALLAVNVSAVSDILSIIGPIELPTYQLTLTGENFLDEVQREVRSGPDRAIGEPKRILKVLTPLLFERLGSLTVPQKHELITLLRNTFARKDMLAYIDDPVMQAYLEQLKIAGEVNQMEIGTLNEYLAVANANIGGGKTDAVMSQSIALKSRIDLEGKINNVLTVRRTHAAKASADAWYNTTNKNYLQIFTPRGSRAISARGADTLPVIATSDFTGYQTDSDLAAIEGSFETLAGMNMQQTIAFNKSVFSGWLNVFPRTTKTLELQYINPQKLTSRSLADYVFIFDKQPGVDTALSFSIDAPPEYKWKENGSATYVYTTPSVEGRVEIRLTLIPIR